MTSPGTVTPPGTVLEAREYIELLYRVIRAQDALLAAYQRGRSPSGTLRDAVWDAKSDAGEHVFPRRPKP